MKREKFQKSFFKNKYNARGMRACLFEKTGNSHDLIKRITSPLFYLSKNKRLKFLNHNINQIKKK